MKKLLIIAMLCLCAQVGYAMNDKEIDEVFFSDDNRNNMDIIIDAHELAALAENNNQLNLICTIINPINNYVIPEDNHNNNDDDDDDNEQPSDLVKRTINSNNQHVCPTCNKNYTSVSHLNQHMKVHTEERPYKCDHPGCGYATVYKVSLTTHIMTHTGERPFKCTECDYATSIGGNLRRHMSRHTGERPFKCTYDGCAYRGAVSKLDLERHIMTHTGEKPFQCNECDYATVTSGSLKRHKSRNHADKLQSNNNHNNANDDDDEEES